MIEIEVRRQKKLNGIVPNIIDIKYLFYEAVRYIYIAKLIMSTT